MVTADSLPKYYSIKPLQHSLQDMNSLLSDCDSMLQSFNETLSSLTKWGVYHTTLDQSISNRKDAFVAIDTLESSDRFVIENRMTKCKVSHGVCWGDACWGGIC